MKLRALRLWNTRRFDGRGVAIENIGNGVSVLSAPNESGKSTALDAMETALFTKHDSRAAPVKSLSPHSGGSPLIELDIETRDGLFRIRKRFLRQSTASVTDLATSRIVAQGADAENWIEREIRDGMHGPTGLLWVKQGITAFDTSGKKEMEEERKTRETIVTSVTGEVETLTGGRRMTRVLAEVKGALDAQIVQSGRAKTGSPYDQAQKEVASLTEETAALEAKLNLLRDELLSRARLRETLDKLTDPEAIRARIEAARTAGDALTAAQSHARTLEDAQKTEQLARTKLDAAQSRLGSFRTALSDAANTAKDLADVKTRLEIANTRNAEAIKAQDSATRALATLAAARTDAENAHKQAMRVALSAQHRDRHQTALENLSRADAARIRFETAAAKAKTIPVDADTLARLRTLSSDLDRQREQAASGAARIRMDYAPDAVAKILQDGEPLADGRDTPLTGPVTLTIAGYGDLTITPGRSETDARTPDVTAKTLADALAKTGADDLAAAETLLREKSTAIEAARDAQAELRALAPDGIDALRQEVSRLASLIPDDTGDHPDPETTEAAMTAAREAFDAGEAKLEQARAALKSASETLWHLKSEARTLSERLTTLDHDLGPEDQRADTLAELEKTVTDLTRAHMEAAQAVQRLSASAPDLAAVTAAANRTKAVMENAELKIQQTRTELAKLDGSIASRADEGLEETHLETKGRLQAAQTHLAHIEHEIAVLKRLHAALEKARANAAERYLAPVITELAPLLSMLLGDAEIRFDETTLLPTTVERGPVTEDISILSGGMREQLAILTRLAFARLLARDGRHVPVILDDPLVFTDDARIAAMFDVLHRTARDLQIVVLTCHETVFRQLGATDLTFTDWTPKDQA